MDRQARPDLSGLAAQVSCARAKVTAARDRVPKPPGGGHQATDAQRELLTALEAYAQGLAALGFPLPHSLRTELAMYRSLLQVSRARHDTPDAAPRHDAGPEPRG